VGLVQAFMHDPELVFLDEPTSGLDPIMQQRFYSLARQERASGRTIFMSSHLLSEVEAVCDRVAIVREGSIVLVESLESLRSRFGKELKVTFGSDVPGEALALPGVGQRLVFGEDAQRTQQVDRQRWCRQRCCRQRWCRPRGCRWRGGGLQLCRGHRRDRGPGFDALAALRRQRQTHEPRCRGGGFAHAGRRHPATVAPPCVRTILRLADCSPRP
jgi:energy-coupling factor transporter ATP-binding protein EcfA2